MPLLSKCKKMTGYKATLDRWFSLYIRLRDSDANGFGRCISCGKIIHWKKAHNGHFINRQHMNLRFDERNCNLQCPKCNTYDEGNNVGYEEGLIKKYGEGIIKELRLKKTFYKKYSDFEYKELIKYYKQKVKDLEKQKNG